MQIIQIPRQPKPRPRRALIKRPKEFRDIREDLPKGMAKS
jgi:hypothetical protein